MGERWAIAAVVAVRQGAGTISASVAARTPHPRPAPRGANATDTAGEHDGSWPQTAGWAVGALGEEKGACGAYGWGMQQACGCGFVARIGGGRCGRGPRVVLLAAQRRWWG